MADYSSVNLPPPKDWQAFERKIRLLFEHSLGDPHTQNNGRVGQPQQGVDVYGRRGGPSGHFVGIQCKGKDSNYGGAVAKTELEGEVEATVRFVPEIHEFILVTTAQDDTKIQEEARLLQDRLYAAGRRLSVSVWGWGRLQQEIARFPEVFREFSPDGSPFSDEQRKLSIEIKNLVDRGVQTNDLNTRLLHTILERLPLPLATDAWVSTDRFEKHVNDEIDTYRELARSEKPRTALDLLTRLKDRVWDSASSNVRFRILSNMGAAHHYLGNFERAAELLFEAAALDPNNAKAIGNRISAFLLKNQKEDAHRIAVEATSQLPRDADLAALRVLAVAPDEDVEKVWHSLAPVLREKADAHINRVVALRSENDPRWYRAADEGMAAHPQDSRLKTLWAESIIDRTLQYDPGAIGLATSTVPGQAELTKAADTLVVAWRATLGKETAPMAALGHNGALAKSLVGETDAAIELLDEVVGTGYNSEETKQLRVSLYRKSKRIKEAIAVADTLADSPVSQIIRADVRTEYSPAEAREILKDRGAFREEREIVGAALTVVETYCEEGNFANARAEAERLKQLLPGHPQGPLAEYRIKKQNGEPDALGSLEIAVQRITPETDFPTRFLVCEALRSADRPDTIVELLGPYTGKRIDSPALRLLVAAAVNADRRVTLSSILETIPPELAGADFYQRAGIALALRTGRIDQAEKLIRRHLAGNPQDLEMHLRLMTSLFRQNKMKELHEEARQPPSNFIGPPELFIQLAQLKNDFGEWEGAYALAYRLLLDHPANQAVNLGYVGVFLRERDPGLLDLSPSKVDVGMAVGVLRAEDKQLTVYVIESDRALRPGPTYLAPDHALAVLLTGRAVGDQIELPDHSVATVAWIKPKELHALHIILEEFNNLFPDAEGLEKVRINTTSAGGMQPMLERVRMRHDAVQNVAGQYDKGILPLSLLARLVGASPVAAFLGLIQSRHKILVCEGTHFERDIALKAIRENRRNGCVVDAIGFHLIRSLKLEKSVEAVCGPIGVVERTTLRFQEEIHEMEGGIDQPSLSIFYLDGQYYREEATPERKKASLTHLQADRQWLADHAEVISATGDKDPSPEWRSIEEKFGGDFLDEIRAARSSDRLLLSEDHVLRVLAKSEFGVPGTWLQPVLMHALEEKTISDAEYLQAILGLIDFQEEFISISSKLLCSSVSGAKGHKLPSEFVKLASRLGGPKATDTHLWVALNAVANIWTDISLTPTIREAVLGTLLENLTKGRNLTEIRSIIEHVVAFGERKISAPSIAIYVNSWLRGHFIRLDGLDSQRVRGGVGAD